MKNLILIFLLLPIMAVAQNRYVGKFIGDGSALSNTPAGSVPGNVLTNNAPSASIGTLSTTTIQPQTGSIAITLGGGSVSSAGNTLNAGGFSGNGSGLTGLALTNVTGTGDLAAKNATTTSVSGATNIWGTLNPTNLPYAAQGATPALTNLSNGSGSSLTGLGGLIDGSELLNRPLAGQPHAATQKPWFIIYVAPYTSSGPPENEAYITNVVYALQTNATTYANGFLGFMTNTFPDQMAVYLDVGAISNRLPVSAANYTNYFQLNFGDLVGNAALFPHGIPWLAAFLRTNGINHLILQMYATTNRIPAGADSWMVAKVGQPQTTWTNGFGTIPTDGADTYTPMVGPDTHARDMAQMFAWGCDVTMADEFQTFQQFVQLDSLFGGDTFSVQVPGGLQPGSTNQFPYPGFVNVGGATSVWNTNAYQTFNWNTFERQAAVVNFGRTMFYMAYQSPNANQRFTLGSATTPYHAAVFYDNTGQSSGGAAWMMYRLVRDFPTVKHTYEGAYVSWENATDDQSLMACSMTHGLLFNGYVNEKINGTNGWNGIFKSVTNSIYTRVWNDPLQNWPLTLSWYGTNVGGIWGTKLIDGSWAILMAGSATTSNQVVNWTQLGWPSNLVVQVQAVQGANIVGNYTNAYALNVSANSAIEYIFTPVAFSYLYSGDKQIWTNTATGNGIKVGIQNNQSGYAFANGVSWIQEAIAGNAANTGNQLNYNAGIQVSWDNNVAYGPYFASIYTNGLLGAIGTIQNNITYLDLTWNSTVAVNCYDNFNALANLSVVGTISGNGSGITNGFQNAPTYTNFLFGSSFTNTTTRSELVFVNARCNPTTVVSALFGLVTSPTGAIYTTNGPAGLEADTIFTTTPHGWFQLTAIVQPGGIWKVVDISGGAAVTITNSGYQTLQ